MTTQPDTSSDPMQDKANTKPPTISDLAELFHKDPEALTEQDTDMLVTALREKREKFVAKEAKPKATKAKAPVAIDTGELKL